MSRSRRNVALATLASTLGWHGRAAAHVNELHWAVPAEVGLQVLLPLLLGTGLYVAGCLRTAAQGRLDARAAGRGAGFGVAMLLLAAALVWPLDAWAGRSFAAHMAQHMVLAVLAPPLLLLGRPGTMALRGLPPHWRHYALGWRRWPGRPALAALTASAGLMSLLHGATLWAWHVPAAFELALRDPAVHWLEHLTLLGTGLLFWRLLLRARGEAWGRAAFWSLVTVIHSGFLGALLTLAPRPLYATYAATLGAQAALQDQQLAGLIMWVPMAMVYLVATLALLSRGLGRPDAHEPRGAGPHCAPARPG